MVIPLVPQVGTDTHRHDLHHPISFFQLGRVIRNYPVQRVNCLKLAALVVVIPKHFDDGMTGHQHVVNPCQRLLLKVTFLLDVIIKPALDRSG